MLYAARVILLALVFASVSVAAHADSWKWVFVDPGSGVGVLRGTAEVERHGDRVAALLREPGETKHHSKFSARLRNGKLSGGSVVLSHTDGGPLGLSQGRWLVHKMSPASTLETIWLHAPSTGHYLVMTRSTNR
jgi:hypothetical protein